MDKEIKQLSLSKQTACKTIFAAFQILKAAGGQLLGREVINKVREKITLTEWEKQIYEKTGYVRWESIFHFYTIDCIKARYLRKNKGVWYLTDEGDKAISLGPLAASSDNIKVMKTLATILLTILTTLTFAQKIFKVDNFSKDYYGKILIGDTSEVFSKGWVAIYDRKTNNQIIKVISDELALTLHEDKAFANIKSLPYGEQSLIMYDDFNFDGKKDLAICDGQNSSYHLPSFKIYLASEKGFLYSKEFTRLSQEYTGMFNIDTKEKRIYTMAKSGCCWHEFSEFMIVNNKPKVIKIVTNEQGTPFNTTTEEIWNEKTMVKKSVRTIDIDKEGIEVIFSFNIPKNNKQVVLYSMNGRMLYYALVRKDSTVEFSYPIKAVYQNPDFQFDSTANKQSVTFKNKNATYKVYEQQSEIGIIINAEGKTSNWVGDIDTKKGSLNKLRKVELDNLY